MPALLGGHSIPRPDGAGPRWPLIEADDEAAVLHALRHEDLSAFEVESGPLFDFEADIRQRFRRSHALLVGSGTAALQSAVFALDLGPGDEVVVPVSTYPGSGAPVLHRGATVRFCDVDPDTGNPTPDTVAAVLGPSTRAIIVAHAWGLPVSPAVFRLAEERGLAVIEDGARALGSRLADGRAVGSLGTAACFSFHALKVVPAGEGGVLLTDDRELYERAVVLGHYFRSKVPLHLEHSALSRYRQSSLGLNLKIHPLAAALARSQMAKLDGRLAVAARMQAHLERLTAGLDGLFPLPTPPWSGVVSRYGHMFHWRPAAGRGGPTRDTVVAALKAEGLPASELGSPPLNTLALYRDPAGAGLPGRAILDEAGYPGAEAFHASAFRLQTVFEDAPAYIEWYARALAKVIASAPELARWEAARAALGRG